MAITWTLSKNEGEAKTLAEWGLANPVLRRQSQAPDILTLQAPQQEMDATAVFDYGDILRLYRQEGAAEPVQWFYGRVDRIPRFGTPNNEGMAYEVAGPWWWLDHLVYKLYWTVYFTGEPALAYKSHVFLNKDLNDIPLTTAQQIQAVIDFALEHGLPAAPIELAAETPALNIPVDEVRDTTCGEVIRKQLRWMPDAVTWFDYSTETPTLYIRRRSALAAVTMPIADGVSHESLGINPRYDLRVPAVELIFEKRTQVNGATFQTVTRQIAPAEATGRELGALVATVDLQGRQVTVTQSPIEVTTPDIESVEFWKQKKPVLDSARVKNLTITEAEYAVMPALPRELVNGVIADWMNVSAERATVKAKVSYTLLRDPEGSEEDEENIAWKGTKEIAVEIMSTNAETRTYSSANASGVEEPEPANLASDIYAGLSVLHYEGEYTFVEEECSGAVGMGNVINLSGGRAEWASMNATIQSTIEELETGRTTVVFGPPAHLAVADFLELLRVNRNRFVWSSNAVRATGAMGGSNVAIGKSVAKENTTEESTVVDTLLVQENEELTDGGKVILKGSLCNGKTVKPREIKICEDGVAMRMMVVGSEPYIVAGDN